MNLPKTVYILCVGTLINRAGSMVLPFLVLYLADHHGMTGHQATTTMGLFGVGSIVAALVGGWLADHLGRRIIMIASLVGSGAVLCVFAELRGTAILGAAVFLFALLTDMYRPAAQAMIADTVETDIRPQAYGLMYLAINLGFAISPILGGWLVMYSFKALFVVDALTTLAYAAIIFMLIKETRPARDSSALPPCDRAIERPQGVHSLRVVLFRRAHPGRGLFSSHGHTAADAAFTAVLPHAIRQIHGH